MQNFSLYKNSEQLDSPLNLGGLKSQEDMHIVVRKHKRYNTTIRPYKQYRNWARGFQIPWVCFFECGIMALYFFFGFLYQRSIIDFSVDFSKAINDYFLSNLGFSVEDDGKISVNVPIYFKSQFIEIANETGYRFLNFQDDIPSSNIFYSDEILYVHFEYTKSETDEYILEDYNFTKTNISQLYNAVKSCSENIPKLSMSSTYYMERNITNRIEIIKLSVFSDFTFNERSRIITMNSHHKRIPNFATFSMSLFVTNPLILTLIVIICLSICCIVFNIYYIRSTYIYSKKKAVNNFQDPRKKFSSKFDRWSIYSIFCHIVTIAASLSSIIYNFYDDKSFIPISMIFMALSSFFHTILLLRYLKQKPQIMIIINVATTSIIKIFEFLVGCITIFIAYTIFGSCLFGTYDTTFRSFIDSAECLLAVIHGDSIQTMFDAAELWPDLSRWYGIIYWGLWIFFSLTIMFNISISIFEEVLTKEIYKTAREAQERDHAEEAARDQFTLALPLSYRKVY